MARAIRDRTPAEKKCIYDFAIIINEKLKEKKINQTELANNVGMSRKSINEFLKKKERCLNMIEFLLIIDYLDIEIERVKKLIPNAVELIKISSNNVVVAGK